MKTKIIIFLVAFALFLPGVASALVLDATGGECSSVGTWDVSTQTCTLSQDVSNNPITIVSDNMILDGDGHSITGPATTNGITVSIHQNIVVKNVTLSGFAKALVLTVTKNARVENNVFMGNFTAISTLNGAAYGPMTGNIYRNNIFEIMVKIGG